MMPLAIMPFNIITLLLWAAWHQTLVFAIPYSEYILAPDTRTLFPVAVHRVNGTVNGASSLTNSATGSAVFHGVSAVTFDYGKNIAGIVSVTVGRVSSPNAFIGLTFSESSVWINGQASDATADAGLDAVVWLSVGDGPGVYTVEPFHLRGAFKYLSLVSNTTAVTEITSVSTEYTAAPQQDLRAYTGYFHSNDELLNRIWYAGAYTNQLCTIDPSAGNSLVHLLEINSSQNISLPQTDTWFNNFTISPGNTVLVDGAKRDRLVWPGDMSISLPGIFVSTNDLISVQNALNSLLVLQNATTGMLPYAGIPFSILTGHPVSFTYHLYSLIGLAYYYRFSGDLGYIQSTWSNFTKGLEWSLGFIDDTGLMDVTSSNDWLRSGMGGHNIEANAILYHTLIQGIELANILNDTASAASWASTAATVKQAANDLLWDASVGLYVDNETTTLNPQDGNSWAVKTNLTLSSSQNEAISAGLKARWGQFGAPAPEAGATVSPFISGFEIEAHFLASDPQSALDLIRLQWGFMLNDPRMTNSTWIEGYSTDGSLHYAPYTNDPRISYAHGWATGPTSVLTFYAAGIRLIESIGKVWVIQPQIGDLKSIDAGFQTPLGFFGSTVQGSRGVVTSLNISTPVGTTGSVVLDGVKGSLVSSTGKKVTLVNGVANGLDGGSWVLRIVK